jgi:hypothetical protein
MKTIPLLAAALVCCSLPLPAAPLNEGTLTEIIREVSVVPQATQPAQAAKVNAVVRAPDLVRTGAESRAEITAPDQTITRVGANTVFSFEAGSRTLNLKSGSVLFHAPKGKGGGTIKSGGASASVLGTTMIVTASEDGGFKVVMLEGSGRVKPRKGFSKTLRAGQMAWLLPDGRLSPVYSIDLRQLVAGSQLVNGFSRALPSLGLIQAAIAAQARDLERGRLVNAGPAEQLLNQPPGQPVDPRNYQIAVPPRGQQGLGSPGQGVPKP